MGKRGKAATAPPPWQQHLFGQELTQLNLSTRPNTTMDHPRAKPTCTTVSQKKKIATETQGRLPSCGCRSATSSCHKCCAAVSSWPTCTSYRPSLPQSLVKVEYRHKRCVLQSAEHCFCRCFRMYASKQPSAHVGTCCR